jgi:hypothetical protein
MIPELIMGVILFWVFIYLMFKLKNQASKKKLSKITPMDCKPIKAHGEMEITASGVIPNNLQEIVPPKLDISAEDILKKLED